MRPLIVWAIVTAFALLLISIWAGTLTESSPPLVVVYTDWQAVDDVTVSITNPHRDIGILITSVEFKGQLPELRYFYHGIYGSISKHGDCFVHNAMVQSLSMPVGSCFLLPGQSTTWQRPLRVLDTKYEVEITWREIPTEKIATSVWFESRLTGDQTAVYELLSTEREPEYSNLAAASSATPRVIIDGDSRQYRATSHAVSRSKYFENMRFANFLTDFPDGSVEVHLEPIAEKVLVTAGEVQFREYNAAKKMYEDVATPSLKPTVIDFLVLCARSENKAVPCILAKKHFSDIVDVEEELADMYYNPGITRVPLTMFPKLLARIEERGLPVRVERIDPNSLGMHHVLTVGVNVDERGKEV